MGPKVPADPRIDRREPLTVSLLVLPEASIGGLAGMLDTLSSFPLLATFDDALPREPPFTVELVAASRGRAATSSGIELDVHRSVEDPITTDIAIVPSVMVAGARWQQGRHP